MATREDAVGEVSIASISGAQKKSQKSHDILTCTIRRPQHAYAHLRLVTEGIVPVPAIANRISGGPASSAEGADGLDALEVRSYLTSALQQFLGLSGAAMPVDILKVEGRDCWVRIPEPDMGAFAAAIASWSGAPRSDSGRAIFQLTAAGNWLGGLIERNEQHKLWDS